MSIHARGFDRFYNLGINPITSKTRCDCTDDFTPIPIDLAGIQCLSGGLYHTVIIKDRNVFTAGYNEYYVMGSDYRRIYEKFT